MVIGVDIGNTTTEIGFIENLNDIKSYRFFTDRNKTTDEWRLLITDVVKSEKIFKADIKIILISSVVPSVEERISDAFQSIFNIKPLVLNKDIEIPIKNRYKNPEEVGTDRLLNAYSASKKIKPPLIVVDLGTAVTFDVVNDDGSYEGGLIFPGVSASIECLFYKTSKLPKVDLTIPETVVGRSTLESINNGIFWGYVSLINGVINLIEKEYRKTFKVIITGGSSDLISRGLREGFILSRKLAMEGIYYLSKQIGS